MEFKLTTPNQICGDQLVDEVKSVTGIDINRRYTFIPSDIVEIHGEDVEAKADEIQRVVAAHVPAPPTLSKRSLAIQSLRERAKGTSATAANARDLLVVLGLE